MIINPEKLSPQEITVLRLLAQCQSDTQIGKEMSCTADTVRHHLFSIRKKIGCTEYTRKDIGAMRVQLAIYTLKIGLISLEDDDEQYRLPSRTHIVEMRHRYTPGNRVCVINKDHMLYRKYGIIKSPMPYTFKYPAYNVKFGDRMIALSESSLERG